ncbi:hypothetical protein EYZ11_011015 [Aspergillus tanneri]|uniref:Forkhead domain protein n=1 Tax=Aspergillus tanneri TaxID=1220188 RepID=A0A4S3J475_9EURO|nr:hypothetical protein EYZ11_011015 [Aspergillus tanneri]
MSSSQTMTAPAVGHRPPDAGPSMSSMYDYGRSQQPDDHPSTSSPTDAAILALHDSALPPDCPANNGLPATMPIKTEPEDSNPSSSPAAQNSHADVRRQSAASALLAQLLGNHSSAPSDGTIAEQPVPSDHKTDHLPGPDDGMNGHHWSTDPPAEPSVAPADPGTQDQSPTNLGGLLSGFQQEGKNSDQPPEMSFSNPEHGENVPAKTADPIDGLTDPLLLSKSNLDHSDLFSSFDITAAPKNPYEALHQNEMLTAAYLSQSADLSALGYSGGSLHQEGAGSMAGSEPRIQAFAKLEFDDGHFYCNTYSFILGRDVRAARAAHERELQARQAVRTSRAKSSSGGNTSQTPARVKHEGSGIIGSVVSDRGGILGFDPDVPPHLPRSGTDYNALAMQSLHDGGGDAKPVDTLALLPSPDACPTIPIHPPATADGIAAGHRGISRKHVKIAYNFEGNFFEMEVMGRNGAFIGADWLSPGQVRPLHSGDYIQIGGVRIRFLLPDVPIGETGAEVNEESRAAEDEAAQAAIDNDGTDDKRNKDGTKSTKLILKTRENDSTQPVPSIEGGADGSQQPIRRRGPGRPPKDGIMSKRERAELAREQKMAAKREANGGITPPPQHRSKSGKTTAAGSAATAPKESLGVAGSPESKPEKRKYTKRKKLDGTSMDFPLPSTEGGQFPMEQRPEDFIKAPPVKKRKPSRSPSPNYPPESAYTPEDLAKPPYNYAVLIFDALTEAATPMTLKQIYRALKLKYPYFRFKCETEGWTSSVRHNLNGNSHLFMHAERDGKGWSWQLRPGASVEKEKKRRPSPPPPVSQPSSVPAATPQYMPPTNSPYAGQPSGQTGMANPHYQFPSMPANPYAAPSPAPVPSPAPPQSNPFPIPPQAAASTPFPIPSPLRNNLPPAFAQTTPSTYTSPYASDPPPQLVQFQQSQQLQQPHKPQAMPPQQHQLPPPPPQQQQLNQHQHHHNPQQPQPQQHALPPQHHSPYPPQNPPPMSNLTPQPQNLPPASGPLQHQASLNMASSEPSSGPMDNSEALSFNDRASKAIDDFEAVLMEDYEDKNYIREVLKSARARVLGEATESSFPGGEPKDEAVILDALRNLIGSLKDQ